MKEKLKSLIVIMAIALVITGCSNGVKEETKVEETKVEETKVEETKVEETKVEETKVEEVKTEEVKSEEVKSEEVKTEEVKTEEVKTEEVKTEEVKSEEVKSEEAKSEEVKSEEAKAEEVKSEEAKSEEAKAEEVKTEEVKSEEAVVEEAKGLTGTFSAKGNSYDDYGWKPSLSLTFENGTITNVNYDEVNADGGKKSGDTGYLSYFNQQTGVKLDEVYKTLSKDLLAVQAPESVDSVSGATIASDNFVKLAKKIIADNQ